MQVWMTIISTLVFRMCSKYGGPPFDALSCEKRHSIVLHVIRLVDVAKICKCALATAQVEVNIGDTLNQKVQVKVLKSTSKQGL